MTFWHLKKENSSFSSPSQMLGHNKTNQRLSVPPENHVCGKGSKAKEEEEKEKGEGWDGEQQRWPGLQPSSGKAGWSFP